MDKQNLGKAFEKRRKTIEERGKKTNECSYKSKQKALTNKDDYKSISKEIFNKLVKEIFDEIKELSYEIDHDDLICFFKN